MNKIALKKILSEYKEYRLARELEASARYSEALLDTNFKLADELVKRLTFEIARLEAYGKDSCQAKKDLDGAKKERASALKELGLSEKDLKAKVRCKKCNDTGFSENGELCNCVKQRLIEILKKNCGMSGALKYRFSDGYEDIFRGSKQEKTMLSLYKTMQVFCEKFPKTKYLNILLCGAIGVGKSYLISALANDIMERGYSVLYLTAFDFNNLVLKYHVSSVDVRNEYLDDMLSAELLIIDDLGTEPLLKNVSVDYLFSVISSRMERGLHTVFSTNLDANNLLMRYGERVFSRLFHKQHTFAKKIEGDDLRLKKVKA